MSNFRKIDASEALKRVGEAIVADFKRLLIENGSVDTSDLLNSINYEVNDNILKINMLYYGVFVDKGTAGTNTGNPDRKMPPISAISGWANRKGINPWALAKTIQKWGTKAKPFTQSFDEFETEYYTLLDNSMFIELDMFIDRFIMELKNRQW